MPKPIVLVCSVELEAKPLLDRIERSRPLPHPRLRLWAGRLGGFPVVVAAGGIGKTNAAHALTAILERYRASAVIGFGVGGAYPGSGLDVGDLAVATAEHYGDEGVATGNGWISCEDIGIPLLADGGRRYFNELPVDQAGLESIDGALRDGPIAAMWGPFVTVSNCSGTTARGVELAERFGAVCESMEGAAYAHVAALYRLPYLELRGISNLVEDRDTSRWRLHEAAGTAAAGVRVAVENWRPALAETP